MPRRWRWPGHETRPDRADVAAAACCGGRSATPGLLPAAHASDVQRDVGRLPSTSRRRGPAVRQVLPGSMVARVRHRRRRTSGGIPAWPHETVRVAVVPWHAPRRPGRVPSHRAQPCGSGRQHASKQHLGANQMLVTGHASLALAGRGKVDEADARNMHGRREACAAAGGRRHRTWQPCPATRRPIGNAPCAFGRSPSMASRVIGNTAAEPAWMASFTLTTAAAGTLTKHPSHHGGGGSRLRRRPTPHDCHSCHPPGWSWRYFCITRAHQSVR